MLVKDTRGRIFKLADIRGEFLRMPKSNKEYPIVARVRERQDGDFDLLNIVREPAELAREPEKKKRKA